MLPITREKNTTEMNPKMMEMMKISVMRKYIHVLKRRILYGINMLAIFPKV